MPHVIVKMYKGQSNDAKTQLANEIVKDVTTVLGCDEKVVSVAFEDYDPADWPEKVYKPDIIEKEDTLAIKPGYNPFEKD